jgi:hypothetical protein
MPAAKTWLSFNEPIWITQRHRVANADPGVTKMAATLRDVEKSGEERRITSYPKGGSER